MGLMLAFDMGGPVNKVAYAFMLICVSQGVYSVVAIAAVGIAVPPLGMGLATLSGRKYFTAERRGNRQNRAGDGLYRRDRRGVPLPPRIAARHSGQ